MSRRSRAEIRETPNDPRFASRTVTKFINSMMRDGKKSIAEKIFYDAVEGSFLRRQVNNGCLRRVLCQLWLLPGTAAAEQPSHS
jgi:hypothetical protein